jgi:hypothetical protein
MVDAARSAAWTARGPGAARAPAQVYHRRSMSTTLRFGPQDPDEALLRDLNAPPPLADAREALAYWHAREAQLPWHRRAARREARAMSLAWAERVREAEIAALGGGLLGRLHRALLAPRPRVGVLLRRALLAATALSVALGVTFVALVHLLFG